MTLKLISIPPDYPSLESIENRNSNLDSHESVVAMSIRKGSLSSQQNTDNMIGFSETASENFESRFERQFTVTSINSFPEYNEKKKKNTRGSPKSETQLR